MKHIHVLTSWIGDGLSHDTAFRPKLFDDITPIGPIGYTDIVGLDVSNLQPDPNVHLIEVYGDADTMDAFCVAIEAHPAYGQAAILLKEVT